MGGGGGGAPMSSLSQHLRPVRTEETVSHRRNTKIIGGDPASAKQLVYTANRCFNSCAEKSQEHSVQKATVKEQLGIKTIHQL